MAELATAVAAFTGAVLLLTATPGPGVLAVASAGGTMASVVRNLANLPAEDREAIAAYVKGLATVQEPEG